MRGFLLGGLSWVCLFGLATSPVWSCDEIEDGIYFLVDPDEVGQRVSIDGKEVLLGNLATQHLGTVRLRSLNNQNSQYMLELTACGPIVSDEQLVSRTVAMIGGLGIMITGQNRMPDEATGTQNLSAQITGDQADHIAQHLESTAGKREHPGHRMLVTWTAVKPSFNQMEPVEVDLKIRNVGEVPLLFYDGGQQRGARNNQFRFVCFFGEMRPEPDVGDPVNFGGLAGLVTLGPGDEFTKRVDLRDWFAFEETGTYMLLGNFQLTLHHTSEHYTPIWDDWASGPFFVTIDE